MSHFTYSGPGAQVLTCLRVGDVTLISLGGKKHYLFTWSRSAGANLLAGRERDSGLDHMFFCFFLMIVNDKCGIVEVKRALLPSLTTC